MQNLLISALLLLSTIGCASIYIPYNKFFGRLSLQNKSNFIIASEELGFKSEKQQQALLKIFYLAGYLTPEEIWKDLISLNIKNPQELLKSVYRSLILSKALQEEPSKFDAETLRTNLFKDISNPSDVKDFILYLAQNAFGREKGQERNELQKVATISKHKEEYLAEAKILGLTDRVEPKMKSYDAAWILGASRIGLLARASDLKRLITEKGITIKDGVIILAGERPLWAEIDGINPRYRDLLDAKTKIEDMPILLEQDQVAIEEGKRYLLELAKECQIKLNKAKPFIVYTKENCPKGFFPGRTYPNYAKGESRKLTETLMSEQITKHFWPNEKISIIDTKTQGYARPTTITTAKDAAKALIQKMVGSSGDKKIFNILVQTNNPYVQRQTLATEGAVKNALKEANLPENKVILEGIGFPAKQNVEIVHSELACLVAELWKNAQSSNPSSRNLDELLYQTRNKNPITEIMPAIGLTEEVKE